MRNIAVTLVPRNGGEFELVVDGRLADLPSWCQRRCDKYSASDSTQMQIAASVVAAQHGVAISHSHDQEFDTADGVCLSMHWTVVTGGAL